MPPRPFPFRISIGTDIVHIKRIRDILLRADGRPKDRDRFLRRFLTPREQTEFQTRFGDALGSSSQTLSVISKHLAGRWAAKEAAIKAVTWRRLGFHDVVIQRAMPGPSLQAVILDDGQPVTAKHAKAVHSASNDVSPEHSTGEAGDANVRHAMAGIHNESEPNDAGKVGENQLQLPSDRTVDLRGQIAKISISHDGDYATAICLAAENPS